MNSPQPVPQAGSRTPLAILFFLHAAGTAAYAVPLATVLRAHGLESLAPWAFTLGGIAAFISPLMAGALADRQWPPERLLAALCISSATCLTMAFLGVARGWGAVWFLTWIAGYSLSNAPGFTMVTSICLSRLPDPMRQFGPVRVWATWGWMAASFGVSAVLRADESPRAGYGAATIFLCEALYCLTLQATAPPPSRGLRRLRDLFGSEAVRLLRHPDHRLIFLTSALFSAAISTFYLYSQQHLHDLGDRTPSATMGFAQLCEGAAMFCLGAVLIRFRLKWILAAGLGLGALRLGLMAMDERPWLVTSICLHGPVFVLFYATAQVYLEQRIDPSLRAQGQAMLTLMNSGAGSVSGYLLFHLWHHLCTTDGVVNWARFWSLPAGLAASLFVLFLIFYKGRARTAPGSG